MIIEMLRWWYGPGWVHSFKRISTRTKSVAHAFSATTLIATLFSPWKRIQYSGKSFDAKMQAMIDNLVSRIIGFVVRIGVLIAALVMIASSAILGLTIAIIWPLVPVLIMACLVKGIIG